MIPHMMLRLLPMLMLLLGGCVQRTLVIESDPPGALVFLNGQEIGRTPMRQDFLWYGRYDVHLRLEGHETLKTTARIRPPLWQLPPIDLMAELFPLHDRRRLHYTLHPLPPGPPEFDEIEDLVERGEALREELE